MSVLVILREYFMVINEIQELLRETEEKGDERRHKNLEAVVGEREHKNLEAVVFHDDLRSGDLVFITEDVDSMLYT